MSKHLSEDILLEFLESENISEEGQKHLEQCVGCQRRLAQFRIVLGSIANAPEETPPEHIRWAVDSAIQEEMNVTRVSGKINFSWIQIAATVTLILVGFFLGRGTNQREGEISLLKEEIKLLKEVTLANTLKTHSASERILAVNQIGEGKIKPNDRLIQTLIETANTDESPNVRYEAVQALGKFMNEEIVRAEMVRSLEHQNDPLIQIALIQLLVKAGERSAIAPIKKIIEREETIPEVKEQGQLAVEILI